jgi:predicted nucleic acid-binding protein
LILALDTDVLVHWVVEGAAHHTAVRRLLQEEVQERGSWLGLTPQVAREFLHIVTDPRRFANPLTMERAGQWVRDLWEADEVERIIPTAAVLPRTLQLLEQFRLGRKRILDTALAATLELAGVRRIATLNGTDFAVFPFLDLVSPV